MIASVIAVLTCHNRHEKTLQCLNCYEKAALEAGVSPMAVLVDDGSSDGTAAEVRSQFPWVEIIAGDGSLYWNGGMHLAFARAMEITADYYLWLNDDTELYNYALIAMLECESSQKAIFGYEGIVVGSVEDAESGDITYGGNIRKSLLNRIKSERVVPDANKVADADTMNGNCVLIPRGVAECVGNIDSVFVHSMGDNDYGFRAKEMGIPIWVVSRIVGACPDDHEIFGSFTDVNLSIKDRFQKAVSPKYLPPRAWLVFCRRHAGFLWPFIWALPYIKIVISGVFHWSGRRI